jgi:hypothetical protein
VIVGNLAWKGHGDSETVECCARAAPCPFHGQFPFAIRSPHVSREGERGLKCQECVE